MEGQTSQLGRKIALEVSRTLAVYGFAGWFYIVLTALVEPDTLGMKLTHFASFPHDDTFGEVCFLISGAGFFIFNMLRTPAKSDQQG
jgi:hypothetical protein